MCFLVDTGGTDGLLAQKTLEITNEVLSSYKNQGGYDMLGRTKDQIRTTEQVNGAMATCQALKLDALVIIGGIIYYYLLRYYIDISCYLLCYAEAGCNAYKPFK